MIRPQGVSIFIDPVSKHFLRDELFNPASPHNFEDGLGVYIDLKRRLSAAGVEVHTADYLLSGEKRNKLNLYFSFGIVRDYRLLAQQKDVILSSFFTIEAPIVQPSSYRILPDISKYFRRICSYTTPQALARYGCAGLKFEKFHIPYPYERLMEELWARPKTKFLCMLNYNRLCRQKWHELYTERIRALAFFGQFGEIDLYGKDWDIPPWVVGETWIPATLTLMNRYLRMKLPFLKVHPYEDVVKKVYRGEAPSRYETQSQYVFTICYENMELEGWLNENIFDCFMVGTIPIYLGPPDVTDYIPEECFINKRKFPRYEDLRAYLKSLGPKEIDAYRQNGRKFLLSDKFKPFGREAFAGQFLRALEEDAGIKLAPIAAAQH